MHWIDAVAGEILKNRENVIASGTSISGMIHIGNLTDVIIAEGVHRAVTEKNGRSSLLWIMDDMDPLRKVPPQLPKEYERYIGNPVSSIMWSREESFTEHSTKSFLDAMEKIGIRPEVVSGADMYRKGMYDEAIRISLQRASDIRRIFAEVSGSKRSESWLPFNPICENCGKIATTEATGFEGDSVYYRCSEGVAGKQRIDGCGYEGKTSIRNGKLTWRVEWAARWKILGVTCEPFGKEHAAAGGSYDTSKRISEEIFGYPAPYPLIYEHILVAGKKMSKSLGNIITLEELLEILPPEVIRYFFFRVKPTTHKDFDMDREILKLVREYERIERLYFGTESPSKGEDLEELRRIYELSQVGVPGGYSQVPYAHLAIVVQISTDEKEIFRMLERTGYPMDEQRRERVRKLLPLVENFLNTKASESVRFTVKESITEEEKARLEPYAQALADVAQSVVTAEDEDRLTDHIYECAKKHGIAPKDLFRAIYSLILGQDGGPKAGTLLLSLDSDFVVKRLMLKG